MPNLFEILAKSYSYTKNHRFLWFFGFFLTGWGTMNFVRQVDFNADKLQENALRFADFMQNHPLNFALVIAASILLIYGVSMLGAISRVAIIYSGLHLERKEIISMRMVMKNVRKPVWRVFWIGIAINAITIVILSWLAVPLWFVFHAGYQDRGLLLTIIALIIFVPIIVTLSLVNIFSACYVVVYDMKFVPAVKSSFDLFANFWERTMALFAILFVVYFLLFFVSAGLIGMVGLLAYIPLLLLKSLSLPLFFGILSLFISLLSLVLLLINAILNVFTNFAWTLFFLKIVKAKFAAEPMLAEV